MHGIGFWEFVATTLHFSPDVCCYCSSTGTHSLSEPQVQCTEEHSIGGHATADGWAVVCLALVSSLTSPTNVLGFPKGRRLLNAEWYVLGCSLR